MKTDPKKHPSYYVIIPNKRKTLEFGDGRTYQNRLVNTEHTKVDLKRSVEEWRRVLEEARLHRDRL